MHDWITIRQMGECNMAAKSRKAICAQTELTYNRSHFLQVWPRKYVEWASEAPWVINPIHKMYDYNDYLISVESLWLKKRWNKKTLIKNNMLDMLSKLIVLDYCSAAQKQWTKTVNKMWHSNFYISYVFYFCKYSDFKWIFCGRVRVIWKCLSSQITSSLSY